MVTMLDPFIQKILREIWGRRLLRPRQRVVVAVSGGADSMALLHLFNFLRVPLHLPVTAAHLDHALRKGSRRDAEFVKTQCRALDIPFVSERIDVRHFSTKKKLSIEDAARRVRYSFFVRTARRVRAHKIVTAHTRDDQVETALLHIVRGAGLEGARAMSWLGPVGTQPDAPVKLCRPMLGVTRNEIESFLKRLSATWREDLTNQSTRFNRNRVRHKLIPSLKRYNPAVVERLAEFTEILGEEKIFLEREVQKALVRCRFRKDRNKVSIRSREYNRFPAAVKQELFRLAIKKLKGDTGGFGYRNWKLFENWCADATQRRALQLPRGTQARKERDIICFSFVVPARKVKPVLITVLRSGKLTFADRVIRFELSSFPGGKIPASWSRKKSKRLPSGIVDADKLSLPIRVRMRRPGDRFIPLGMSKSKKLQDFLVDAKVPLEERDRIPIFTDKKRIIWIGGLRLADPVKVTPSTRRVLKLYIDPTFRRRRK